MHDEWLRYNCQMSLPGFGTESQQKLQQAKVLIIGVGGLGCPAAQYLTASGVGTIALADFDTISTTNLHRQILYSSEEVGLLKADMACKKLRLQNPHINLISITEKITTNNVMHIINDYDIVVDGTDNFEAKYLLNDACVLMGKPLVYGAIYQHVGQISVLNLLNNDGTYSSNYRDLFPRVHASHIPNCAEGGVIPTIAGMIGCMQANEVIKFITKTGELLSGKLLMIDAETLQSRIIKTGMVSKVAINKLPETNNVPLISVEDLKNNFDKNVYELIDVRNNDERNFFNIGGTHIPINNLEKELSFINKSVIFYCASGKRSAEAVNIAKQKFPANNFYSLDGGMKAWKKSEKILNGKI